MTKIEELEIKILFLEHREKDLTKIIEELIELMSKFNHFYKYKGESE